MPGILPWIGSAITNRNDSMMITYHSFVPARITYIMYICNGKQKCSAEKVSSQPAIDQQSLGRLLRQQWARRPRSLRPVSHQTPGRRDFLITS